MRAREIGTSRKNHPGKSDSSEVLVENAFPDRCKTDVDGREGGISVPREDASAKNASDVMPPSKPVIAKIERFGDSFKRVLAFVEYHLVCLAGKIFGISFVVRYLRNPNPWITNKLLRAFGANLGEDTTIKRSLFLDNAFEDRNSTGDFSRVTIGKDCYIGDCVYFDLANEIVIEDHTVISGFVSFITHADCLRAGYVGQKFPRKCEPIRVGGGSWIGFRATIYPGVTIGKCCVIGGGALLLRDAEAKFVYVGIPATKLRPLE